MSKRDKLIAKIFGKGQVSTDEATSLLEYLGYEALQPGTSHRVFRKEGYNPVSLKVRKQLLDYQLEAIQEALKAHGYER